MLARCPGQALLAFISCSPPPAPSTFLPDSSGLYLPHCCPPCFNQVGGRDDEGSLPALVRGGRREEGEAGASALMFLLSPVRWLRPRPRPLPPEFC